MRTGKLRLSSGLLAGEAAFRTTKCSISDRTKQDAVGCRPAVRRLTERPLSSEGASTENRTDSAADARWTDAA